MELRVNDHVTVTAKILTRDRTVLNLSNEPGTVKKIQDDHIYVETEHGMHYLPSAKVQKAE